MKIRTLTLLALFGLLMRAGLALAAPPASGPGGPGGPGQNGGPPDQPHGPPREALDACNGKKAGDTVSFTTRDGRSMKATCRLIAVPADRDGGAPPMPKK